jgi:hypothetical protein
MSGWLLSSLIIIHTVPIIHYPSACGEVSVPGEGLILYHAQHLQLFCQGQCFVSDNADANNT